MEPALHGAQPLEAGRRRGLKNGGGIAVSFLALRGLVHFVSVFPERAALTPVCFNRDLAIHEPVTMLPLTGTGSRRGRMENVPL